MYRCNHGRATSDGYEFKWANENDTLPGEEWRDVGEPSKMTNKCAQVSNMGRFRCSKGAVKTPIPSPGGYCYVGNYGIHLLVAKAFLPPPLPGQTDVNHRNRNRSDNSLENLEWATHAENIQHSHDTNPNRKSNAEKKGWPLFYRRRGEEWPSTPTFPGAKEAERQLKIPQSMISFHARVRWKGKSPRAINDLHEFMLEPRTDLPGEVWLPLLLPTDPATTSFQPFDPDRVRVYEL
jgi:hypothetical protein